MNNEPGTGILPWHKGFCLTSTYNASFSPHRGTCAFEGCGSCVGSKGMAPRPYWKGYLKLSLVSCPIALFPASSTSERVSFHRLNRQTGNRLKQLLVDSETKEPVNKEDIVRGCRAQ